MLLRQHSPQRQHREIFRLVLRRTKAQAPTSSIASCSIAASERSSSSSCSATSARLLYCRCAICCSRQKAASWSLAKTRSALVAAYLSDSPSPTKTVGPPSRLSKLIIAGLQVAQPCPHD